MSMPVQPPKGTRDFLPEEMVLRRKIIETVRECFILYGFEEIDTPVFEYFELLSRKCGADIEKEIYVFEDKASRKLGLRFELTSPLGRYYASNSAKLHKPFKRYAIGKVYRYENPQSGRYREFYQADADIIGSYSMNVELELMGLADFTLRKLGIENYEIAINNRKILDAAIAAAGIGEDKKDAALRALDKTAKIGENGVVEEFNQNGIGTEKYRSFMDIIAAEGLNDGTAAIEALKERINSSSANEHIKNKGMEGIEELVFILKKSAVAGLGSIKFDPLLVRGLGYYTGPIFEIKSKDVAIGSFAAGGRYDNLVELYGARPEGACGLSFGIERIIDIINEKNRKASPGPADSLISVYIAYISENEADYAREIANSLRFSGINAELALAPSSGIGKEIKYADRKRIRYMVIIGEREAAEKKVSLKNIVLREDKYLGLDEVVNTIKK